MRTQFPKSPPLIFALALLLPAAGLAKTFHMSGDTVTGHWMDCGSAALEPVIKVYNGHTNNDSSKHVTFKNQPVSDLRDHYFRKDGWDRFPPNENDEIHSFTVVGRWEVCEDVNYAGTCKVFGPGLQKWDSDDLPVLSGEVSSFRPIGCGSSQTGQITMETQKLRRPDNSRDSFAECLDYGTSGVIANNGKVSFEWRDGKLSLTANKSHATLWQTGAAGARVCFNSQGNLVMTNDSGSAINWQQGGSQAGSQLILDRGCNLRIVHSGSTLWDLGTSCPN